MTNKQRTEIQKIEETIRNLQSLRDQGLLPVEQADTSIALLRKQLPTYQAKLKKNVAITQRQIDKVVGVGKDGIFIDGDMNESVLIKGDGNEVNIGTQPRAKKESLREAYLNYVLEQVSPLGLSGVVRQSASEAETRLNLSAVYTALLTQVSKEKLAELPEKALHLRPLEEMVWDKQVSVVESLNEHDHMVLLGDPGSGKSTFVNFVALCLAGESLRHEDANLIALTQPLLVDDERRAHGKKPEPQHWDHGSLIPIRVILRDFAARGLPPTSQTASADHVWNFIESELSIASLGEFAALLKKELRDQGGLILFDGLDEVPKAEHRRNQIRSALEGFSAAFPRCRFLVTSRTYAYQKQDWKLKGFEEVILAPFTKMQIANFVERWYEHIVLLRGQNLEDGKIKAEILKRAIFTSERLMSLAERPLLLTLMASLHAWRGGTLPDKRERLYADAVDLLLERWESQRIVRDPKNNAQVVQPSLAEWLKVDRDKMRDLLNQLAYEAHAGQSELTGTADVTEAALISGLMNLSQNPDVKPARLIEYLSDRTGLLIPRGVGVYTFPHRTFQEYLAACYLTDHDYPDLVAKLARTDPNRWREAALLAGAKAASGAAVFALWSLVDVLIPERDNAEGSEKYWGAQIAGQAVIEIADLEKVSDSTQTKIDRLRVRLLEIIEGNQLSAFERVQAGVNLAILGDPRFTPDLWYLPNNEMLGFIHIPAGKFLMGSDDKDKQAQESEKLQHTVVLPDFWIAKFPVTVAQFRVFTEATKYSFGFWNYNLVATQPIVAVTWYEALEYTKWLDNELSQYAEKKIQFNLKNSFWNGLAEGKLHVTLPSEAEWEKSGRGIDGRIYPWGNDFDPEKGNSSETKIGDLSVVGCFPAGASPYGLQDMSGNVLEWTRSLWGSVWDSDYSKSIYRYPYDPKDIERENLKAEEDNLRILRGGSFNSGSFNARCASRNQNSPDSWYRNWDYGFRVALVYHMQVNADK